ncbi:MAG: hypothetical protein PVJ80_14615 [Gemmatimonadota bacterium]
MIVVVNESGTPVRVYVEDSDEQLYELGCLERGETKEFDAPAGAVGSGSFRVRVHPDYCAQRVDDPVKIATRALTVGDDETVLLWLETDLSRSTVEVWAGWIHPVESPPRVRRPRGGRDVRPQGPAPRGSRPRVPLGRCAPRP